MTSDTDAIPDADEIVTPTDIEEADDRLTGVVHRTPLDGSRTFAEMSGAARVDLKLETLQRTGSFKIRGAYNAMAQLSDTARERGVVTASAGNHAQGVALAGDLLDIETTVVVPERTPTAKIAAVRDYGATVVVEGDIYEDAYEYALDLASEQELKFVHPFDDDAVIAGQGTIGRELVDEIPSLDTVVVPIGGGGLIAGIATAVSAHDPDIRVVGVQPAGAAHAKPSLERDEIHVLEEVETVADGIADLRLLEKTFAVLRERVDEVVAVSDEEIAAAMALLAERNKTVAEGAGAAPVAALRSSSLDLTGEHVAAIISGGNVDLSEHAELTRVGLEALGRRRRARITTRDWPDVVSSIEPVVDDAGANLVDVRHTATSGPVGETEFTVVLRGRDRSHLETVIGKIEALDAVTVVEAD